MKTYRKLTTVEASPVLNPDTIDEIRAWCGGRTLGDSLVVDTRFDATYEEI
jgi:hypothetical protein